MNEPLALVASTRPLLQYLPIGLFGSVIGLTGLSLAWHTAQTRYGTPVWIAPTIAVVAGLAFVLVFVGYAVKVITAFGAVRDEFRHSVAGNLFGMFPISLLLLPIVIEPYLHRFAQILWVIGAFGMLWFARHVVSRWTSDRQLVVHATPAWIVPLVGLLNVPLAVPLLALPPVHLLTIFALAVGLFFAIPLFTMIFSRLIFEAPLPNASKSSLLILVAPFAVGYSTYTETVGQTDMFAEALYMLNLFMLAVLLPQLRHLAASCPFRVSWWAVSFPLAASSIAALSFATAKPSFLTDAIALSLLVLTTLVIAGLFLRTAIGLFKGELRTLSAG